MAKKTGVSLEGSRKLRSELKRAGADMHELKEVNERAAHTVQKHAKPWSPYQTGNLQSTLRYSGTQRAGVIRAGYDSWLHYARPIHWGWPDRNIKSQRWVLRSAYETRPVWLSQYEAELEKIISQCKGMKL